MHLFLLNFLICQEQIIFSKCFESVSVSCFSSLPETRDGPGHVSELGRAAARLRQCSPCRPSPPSDLPAQRRPRDGRTSPCTGPCASVRPSARPPPVRSHMASVTGSWFPSLLPGFRLISLFYSVAEIVPDFPSGIPVGRLPDPETQPCRCGRLPRFPA